MASRTDNQNTYENNVHAEKIEYFDFRPFEGDNDVVDKLPEFPLECLPTAMKEYVHAVSESTRTYTEMGGMLCLSVAAACCQRGYSVELTPDWIEPLPLFVAVIAESGENKSSVFRKYLQPVWDYIDDYNKKNMSEINKSKEHYELLTERIAECRKECRKSNDSKSIELLNAVIDERTKFKREYEIKLTITDVTPEQLVSIASNGNHSLYLANSEGGDLLEQIRKGRYDNSVMDLYLQGYDGERIHMERVGREIELVPHLYLSMGLMVQPQVAKEVFKDAKAKGRGLLARFDFIKCGSNIGNRPYRTPIIPDTVKVNYNNLITGILKKTAKIEPKSEKKLLLTEEASIVHEEFHDLIEKRLVEDMRSIQAYGKKIVGRAARIAGILHICVCIEHNFNPHDYKITGDTMSSAVCIAEYLIKHTQAQGAPSKVIDEDPDLWKVKYLWERITSQEKTILTKSELLRLCRRKDVKDADDIKKPLKILVERGYVSVINKGKGKGETIYINPQALLE
jgi:hypothetical protein